MMWSASTRDGARVGRPCQLGPHAEADLTRDPGGQSAASITDPARLPEQPCVVPRRGNLREFTRAADVHEIVTAVRTPPYPCGVGAPRDRGRRGPRGGGSMYLSDRPRHVPGARASGARRHVGTTVVLMGLVSLLTDISSESVSAILPVYVTTILGMSPLAYGVIDGLYQGVSATVRLAGGWVADQWDRPKWVAFVGYATSALTKLALLGAHGFGAITVIITADRLGKGLRTAPRDAVIAASAPPELLG